MPPVDQSLQPDGNVSRGTDSRLIKINHYGDVHINEELYERGGYFAAGGLASMTSRTVTAPIDRLKIYLISETHSKSPTWQHIKKGELIAAVVTAGRRLLGASRNVWDAGGVRSLWAGNGVNIVKMLPEGATKFGIYEVCDLIGAMDLCSSVTNLTLQTSRRLFATWEGVDSPADISVWAQTASGGIGGVAAQYVKIHCDKKTLSLPGGRRFIAYPLDTLRFRVQCNMQKNGHYGHRLLADTAKQMWRAGGLRPFFRGLPWGLLGQYPYSAIDLTMYEYTRRWWMQKNKSLGLSEADSRPNVIATAVIGGFSGAVGASVVWPLNLLRTRLQTSGTVVNPREYGSIMDVVRQTIAEEGWRGLWKGMTPNLIKVIPSVAITYVVYDKCKQTLDLS
ncbi:hypothetical protein LTR78_010985 [Recurvomyces mirabilis]|uniref:Mitochondrial thiamine pyrophosphate carrier 1 n=1 Tax=Recurvomyces mirabilis TaxID=574656 RepID=A0AAE0TLJ7_9PEZI|nr:hypothetical protein LTR78_010985 [Recurvomyces mirabilis]KAK5149417.1 hypothetical protein LTS14_010959 [Recurvomyces mirabilis]